MKKNILTKLLALVLTVFMTMAVCTVTFAESQSVEFSNDIYQKILMAKAIEMYEKYLACASFEEMMQISAIFYGSQVDGYKTLLGTEKVEVLAQFAEKLFETYVELVPPPAIIQKDEPVASEYEYITVNYTKVAPFVAPVTGGH